MKITAHETDETRVLSHTSLAWIQFGPLLIETLLLTVLFVVLGVLVLEHTVEHLAKVSVQHVLLLMAYLIIFGAYRKTMAANAVKLFTSHLVSFFLAGSVFLLSVEWMIGSDLDFRFDVFFLAVAFFMLNSVRPLTFRCCER